VLCALVCGLELLRRHYGNHLATPLLIAIFECSADTTDSAETFILSPEQNHHGVLVFLPLFSLLMVIFPLFFKLCEFALVFQNEAPVCPCSAKNIFFDNKLFINN
jgi:hypothetical protein